MSSRALAVVARGRRRAEALMVDECEIRRATGEPGPLDPETGEREPAPTVVVYAGRCKVQTYEPHESRPDQAGHTWVVQRYHIHIPVSAGPVAVGDLARITASRIAPHLVNRTYQVAGLHHKSMTTAQRLLVDEVTA